MTRFASDRWAHAFCDRCGFRAQLKDMKTEVVLGRKTNIKVCPSCFDPDHPQLWVGRYRIDDPQALRDPRPDPALEESREIPP